MSSRWAQAGIAGAAVAAAGMLLLALPPTRGLERALGLPLLYALRGERPAPPSVRLVAIDSRAAEALGVAPAPERWPRRLHAELVRYLTRAGARVIVFDLFFRGAREPADDQLLAQTFAQAGNVLLASRVRRDTQPAERASHALALETHERPLPLLADAALGVAPMVLPRDRARIDTFWTFKSDGWETPSLPSVALQAYARGAYVPLLALLREDRGATGATIADAFPAHHLERTVDAFRRAFAGAPQAGRVAPDSGAAREELSALRGLYAEKALRYLNFYGPPGHIHTDRYDQVLAAGRAGKLTGFEGKVAFVGFAEPAQTEQRDNYFTVYTREDGRDLSGMEIGATAFANLLDGSTLHEPGLAHLLWFAAAAFAIGAAARLLPLPGAIGVVAGGALLYLWFAQRQFAQAALWWPTFIPLALQAPGALLLGLSLRYREVRRERDKIRKLLGMQVPARAVDLLARELGPLTEGDRTIQGACLMSDIQSYTVLSERLPPTELRKVVNRYYSVVFPPVLRHHGVVVDAVGDSMFALWANVKPEVDVRQRTCFAALELIEALARFNSEPDHPPLIARVGLHYGEVAFGPVGTAEHRETRVIGDIVNAANRIQGLNKQIGTHVLASDLLMHGVDAILARPVGRFKLVGKSTALALFEPLAVRSSATEAQTWLCEVCAQGLAAFATADFARSRALWSAVLDRFADDGPAKYYLALCDRLAAAPVESAWDGVVEITQK